jgi:hypothetical protein
MLQDCYQYTAAVWTLFKRLDFHSQTGGILQGLKWHREGGLQLLQTDKLPALQPYSLEQEGMDYFAGGNFPVYGSPDKEANTPFMATFQLKLELSTDSKNGFIRRNPDNPTERKGHLEWSALVMDAIETAEDDRIDSRLDGTLLKPIRMTMRDMEIQELTISSVIDIRLETHLQRRAQRACPFA